MWNIETLKVAYPMCWQLIAHAESRKNWHNRVALHRKRNTKPEDLVAILKRDAVTLAVHCIDSQPFLAVADTEEFGRYIAAKLGLM